MSYQPGDILACYGRGALSHVIRWGTASALAPPGLRVGPSHVGIVCDWGGMTALVESTTLAKRPCVVHKRIRSGCQLHLVQDRIADYLGEGGRVDVYRLTPVQRFSEEESNLLAKILIKHFVEPGIGYDRGGAAISGTRVIKWTRLLHANLDNVFCSELIAGVLQRLGRMDNADNPTRFNPASLLRCLVRRGTYQRAHKLETLQ